MRGLKLGTLCHVVVIVLVAPLAGAWIETLAIRTGLTVLLVAPLAGTWIEKLDADSFGTFTCMTSMQGVTFFLTILFAMPFVSGDQNGNRA